MDIQKKFIGYGLDNNPNTTLSAGKPLGIIAHQTGTYSPGTDAEAFHRALSSDSTEVSWHATADHDSIIQHFADNRKLWHAGNSFANSNLMGLEMCVYNKNDKEKYLATLRNGAYFIAVKMKEYGWDLSKVYQHKEYANTSCPLELSNGLHGVDWSGFKKMITEELNKLDGKVEQKPSSPPTGPVLNINTLSKNAKKYIGQDGEKSKTYATGSNVNDEWCVYFVGLNLHEVYGLNIKVGYVDEIKALMEKIEKPEKDCLVVFDRNGNTIGDHIGICSYANGDDFVVIEGNTKNEDNMKSIVSENAYNINDLPFTFYRIPEKLKKTTVTITGKPMKIILVEDTDVYRSVENAQKKLNPILYKAGEYTVYKAYGEFANITKTSSPGGWLKLRGIKE